MTIALTGTSGKLGGRVTALLRSLGETPVQIGRDAERMPDAPGAVLRDGVAYDDLDGMRTALAGSERLLLVSGNLSGRRLSEHATAIDAAKLAGVSHVVYVSLLGAAHDATYLNARDHRQTEQYLASSGLDWTVLRPSFYSSMLTDIGDTDGVIRGPAGAGRVSAVAHDDIARVAVAVLRGDGHQRQTYAVTGPEAVTLGEAADRLNTVLSRHVAFEDQTVEQARASRSALGVSDSQVAQWISWYLAIRNGEVARTSDVVARLTGREPMSIEDAVAAM